MYGVPQAGLTVPAVAGQLERIRRDFPSPATMSRHQDRSLDSQSEAEKGKPMEKVTRVDVSRVAVDLAKNVLQIHAEDHRGRIVWAKPLARERFVGWCQSNLPAGCEVAMEACGGAHHWGRRLRDLGFKPVLLAGHLVLPFRRQGRTGKNDANDAGAIFEAAARARIHHVPVKTVEQQGLLSVHRLREMYKRERTALINTIRGLAAEFGVIFPQSPEALRLRLHDALEDAGNEIPGVVRVALQRAHLHWLEIEIQMAWCDEQVALHARHDAQAKAISQIPGIGPLTASALVATVGDFTQFKTADQFASWLGLVPSQDSSGGKARLGRITKRGDTYLRTCLIQGAKSAVMSADKRSDPISQWVLKLRERSGWQKAAVALANKHARIVWAMLVRGKAFDASHVSMMPGSHSHGSSATVQASNAVTMNDAALSSA
jgi:transposase